MEYSQVAVVFFCCCCYSTAGIHCYVKTLTEPVEHAAYTCYFTQTIRIEMLRRQRDRHDCEYMGWYEYCVCFCYNLTLCLLLCLLFVCLMHRRDFVWMEHINTPQMNAKLTQKQQRHTKTVARTSPNNITLTRRALETDLSVFDFVNWKYNE